ncbi:hypothetical protein BJV82DRAFT_574379 [Fennellomyces sp. T-0311]|nr:hypothetical protein BJV82DRAFT_574379 [Fennellomyces sp. T-0311]
MAEAEQTKQQPHVSYAWLLAGESIRMTMELGLQRSCNVSHSPADRELAVRTFWAVFTADRLMAMTYGRPFLFEEKDIWIASMIKEAMSCPPPANAFQSHFETMKRLMLHTLLILLHQPHVDTKEPNVQKKNGISMPSFETTTYSALIITERISELSLQELEYMTKCSPAIYTLLTAMRVHLMNASYEHDDENVRNGEISFLRSMAVIEKAQQYFQEGILLSTTIRHLQNQFFSRSCSVLAEYADKIKHDSGSSSKPIFDGCDPTPSSLMNSAVPGSSVLITSEYRQPPKTTRAGLSRTNKNKASSLYTTYKPDAKGKLTPHRQLQSKPTPKKKRTSRNTEADAQSSSSTQPELQQAVSPGNFYASPMQAYNSGEPSPQNYYTFVEQQPEPAQQRPQQQQMVSPCLLQQQAVSPGLVQQQMVSPSLVQQQMVSPGLIQQQMVSPSTVQQHDPQFNQPSDMYQDPTLAFLHQITQSMEQYGFYSSAPAPGTEMPTSIPTNTYNITPNSMVDNIDTLHTYIVDPSSSQIQITDGNANFDTSIIDPNTMLDICMYNFGGTTSSG